MSGGKTSVHFRPVAAAGWSLVSLSCFLSSRWSSCPSVSQILTPNAKMLTCATLTMHGDCMCSRLTTSVRALELLNSKPTHQAHPPGPPVMPTHKGHPSVVGDVVGMRVSSRCALTISSCCTVDWWMSCIETLRILYGYCCVLLSNSTQCCCWLL